jgi:hypothetical protein
MRYDEFRDRWQGALRTAHVLAHHDRPEEMIDLTTTERRWRVHPLARPTEPFQAGATISFRWGPFNSTRSYTCEEDLLTELFGRSRAGRSTQPRLLRVDITLRAMLPYGSTTPMPAPDVWAPWVASVEETLDTALTGRRRRKGAVIAWRGDLEIVGRSTPDGAFWFDGMSVSAFEMIVLPRIWDDPRRREREASADEQIDGLAVRFRGALDAWTASVGELVKWLRYAPGPTHGPSRGRRNEPSPDDGDAGPETTH